MPVKEAKLLEGKILAAKIQEEIKSSVDDFIAQGFERPRLAALQAGENPSSAWYLGQQEKLAAKLGIEYQKIPAGQIANQKDLIKRIQELNQQKVHGVFLAMPLAQGFDPDAALLALDPRKDIEGIHPVSLGLLVLRKARLIPPTAYASLALIEWAVRESKKNLRGMKAAILGQSAVVGRPLQLLLGERRVTTVVCNTGTSPPDLQKAVSESEIVVACAGQPGFVKGAWIRDDAIVLDVGTTEVQGKLVGDVEFDEAKKRAAFITPVPGGVGPLTVTMLMQNLVHAYQWQKGICV